MYCWVCGDDAGKTVFRRDRSGGWHWWHPGCHALYEAQETKRAHWLACRRARRWKRLLRALAFLFSI